MSASAATSAILSLHWLLWFAAAVEDDVLCLEGVKNSLSDPQGVLSSWTFTNTSASHFCNLNGVTCWNLNESRIISLQLTSFGLSGSLPESLKNCRSLQTLELSGNKLDGPIPTQICQWLPYLVRLDLASNSLSGSIPSQIADCKFLNDLLLSYNKLSGSIPYEVVRLERLKQFDVQDNNLSGSIPSELSKISGSDNFSGNDGLCGKPLGSCGRLSKKSRAIIIAAGVVGAPGSLLLGFGLWWWYFGGASRKKIGYGAAAVIGSAVAKELDGATNDQVLPVFDISTIRAATDNFASTNKLGQGGFGPVYKGRLTGEQEVAVKRLSKSSGQGSEEFKNEVMLIAKLQHRNLVRLLGCCISQDERMLIYEYLPNKSLDYFIFNEANRTTLDWNQRFKIVLGIARGVLYLHQDSRLKIIHRDLKASNVLLDSAMNPKISDFGMAKMFGEDQIQANTNRVVGTYGYMSPEYAMQGLYSIKSDVFSFGVMLLEIVSGKRNTDFYNDSASLNLITHVWNLWKEGKDSDIVDPLMAQPYNSSQVLRSIQIGLLCVQEHAADRPNMMDIVLMLVNKTALASPTKPAFIWNRSGSILDLQPIGGSSGNEVTITDLEGR